MTIWRTRPDVLNGNNHTYTTPIKIDNDSYTLSFSMVSVNRAEDIDFLTRVSTLPMFGIASGSISFFNPYPLDFTT